MSNKSRWKSRKRRHKKFVLVYTRKSKKQESGKVISYDKNGKIALFHRRYGLSNKIKPGQLVICRIITEENTFYILKPLCVIKNGKIPGEYRDFEVWGEKPHKELIKQRSHPRP